MQEFQPGLPISLSASVELVEADARHLPNPLVLKKSLPDAPEQVTARFETAAQVLPRLQTPHAPALRASGLDQDAAYLLMDRVPGQTLADILRRGALPADHLVALGQALARAVHAIHLQGVLHQHLLPSHVMITPDQQAVLLSFGLAHHRECPDLLPAAAWVAAVSSPWMAPEQLYHVRDDPRSDQWSLGALLYQMAVGHPPYFDPANPQRAPDLEARMWRPLAPLRALRPDLPDWLQEVVHRCLEIAPADRYAHCGQVAWALANPATVQVSPARTRRRTLWQSAWRWWQHKRDPVQLLKSLVQPQSFAAQLLVVVVPGELVEGELPDQLRQAAQQWLRAQPGAHLVAVAFCAGDQHALQARLLTQAVQRWTLPLHLPPSRHSVCLLDGAAAAGQLAAFCHHHLADLVIVADGHDPHDHADAYPVSALALASALRCSVHLVRAPRDAALYQEPPSALTR